MKNEKKNLFERIFGHKNQVTATAFPAAAPVSTDIPAAAEQETESALLTQVQEGIHNHEFTFYLHPRYDLNTKTITGAEALVRWNHPKKGVLAPAAFMGILERNGYITRLDRYLWDLVCSTLRNWIVSGKSVVPIIINISKTDILAMDVAEVLNELIQKYQIPSRYIEIDLNKTAYLEAAAVTIETENALRRNGFRVLLDSFDGNFSRLSEVCDIHDIRADAWKLNMRFQKDSGLEIPDILQQAREQNIRIEGLAIENINQLHDLRKGGCAEGEGYYFSRPLTIEGFEQKLCCAANPG